MRRQAASPLSKVSLFPFLSVLLCIMGVLAFISISFLLLNQANLPHVQPKKVEFQWVGAPANVKPLLIRSFKDEVVYYNLFLDEDQRVPINSLIREIQEQDGRLTRYFLEIVRENQRIKRSFGTTEYYPLLLVYPDSILTTEFLTLIIERINDLNVGLEPMLSNWDVPYQSEQ